MKINGILFDMDGVLCDSEPFIFLAARQMFQETYGVSPNEEDFHPFVGAGEDRYLGGVAEKYGTGFDLARDKERTYSIYLDLIHGKLRPLTGAAEFVRHCRALGLHLAIASSADTIKVRGNLRQIGLDVALFDAILTGNDVTRKKPDPEIYLLAAKKIGVPPQHCLVVEDAPNGLRAGKAAGAACLGITSKFGPDALRAAGADWTAPDLAHVPADVLNSH